MPSRTEAAKRGLAISFSTLDSAFSSRWPSPLRLAQNWKIYCTKQYSFLPLSVGHQTLGQSSLASAVRGLNQFPWKAPIGYINTPDTNTGSNISPDSVRGPLIPHAFNAIAAGQRSVEDVRKEVTVMGLRSNRGREMPRQSFHHLLRNALHSGWVVSGDVRVKGLHQPRKALEITVLCQTYRTKQNYQMRKKGQLGWETGFEPATFGATDRRSTS